MNGIRIHPFVFPRAVLILVAAWVYVFCINCSAGDPTISVLNGIDELEGSEFKLLDGRRVGLITNHTGLNIDKRSTIDLLANAKNFTLVKLFSPEHGIRGTVDGGTAVEDGIDQKTGLPIVSLFKQEGRKPNADHLSDIDTLVFDIQDVGSRFYTYTSTMGLTMEAASEFGKKYVVLDRINPINGTDVDGPVRTGPGNDFVAYHDIPVRHGMTVGELAMMFKAERGFKYLDLRVVPIVGWERSMHFDQTALPWRNPSPNIRSATQALLYPGVGLLEFCNLSVGRGTKTPFEIVGAPWITEGRLAARLNQERLPGIAFRPTRFTPMSSIYKNEDCGGVKLIVTNRDKVNPIDVGLALGRAIQADYPRTFTLSSKGNTLLRHPETHELWVKGGSIRAMRKTWDKSLKQFKKRRVNYLIYK